MRRISSSALLIAVIALSPLVTIWPAAAQNPQPAPPHVTPPPVALPNAASPPPEKIAPKDDDSSHRTVVTPPKVDPDIVQPPPAHGTSTMPVIKPPAVEKDTKP